MNWLGSSLVSLLATLIGVLVGSAGHVALRSRGIDFPPVVGAIAGFAAAISSRDKSGLRGVLVASLSVWAGAVAEIWTGPARGLVSGLAHFHDSLDPLRAFAYVGSVVVATFLGSRAWRPASLGADLRSRAEPAFATKRAARSSRRDR